MIRFSLCVTSSAIVSGQVGGPVGFDPDRNARAPMMPDRSRHCNSPGVKRGADRFAYRAVSGPSVSVMRVGVNAYEWSARQFGIKCLDTSLMTCCTRMSSSPRRMCSRRLTPEPQRRLHDARRSHCPAGGVCFSSMLASVRDVDQRRARGARTAGQLSRAVLLLCDEVTHNDLSLTRAGACLTVHEGQLSAGCGRNGTRCGRVRGILMDRG